MLKRLIIFVFMLCFAVTGTAFAATSRTLDKNTELHPQGWSVGETIKFKKNTAVRLNDNGEVISGTLADDTYLRPHGWQRIINDHYFVSAYTGGGWFPRHQTLRFQATGICATRITLPLRSARRARF